MQRISYAMVLLWLTACVGTDYLAEPDILVPPRIVITPANTAVEVGKFTQLHATYYDSLGRSVAGLPFEWRSSDTNLVALSVNGVATGRAVGQVQIFARARGVMSDAARLTIVANTSQVARVLVLPDSGALVLGETLQCTAIAQNLEGAVLSGKSVAWRSTAATIVAIDNSGLATALQPGTAQLIATIEGVESLAVRLTVFGTQRSGTFMRNTNTAYTVSGTATLEQQRNGSVALQLGNDFFISNGPGLEVFLSHANTVTASSINLGRLQKISGEQSYAVPTGVKLSTYNWVVMHCVPFNVTFGFARLQ